LAKYGTRIRFVFRQFPLINVHEDALRAAEASECAADQGKFWEAERKLYENQLDLSEPALERYAGELGLDQARFKDCLTSGAEKARVMRDVEDAHALGLNATPTFFIGDQEVVGPIEISDFFEDIDNALAKAAAPGGNGPPGTSLASTPNSAQPYTLPGSNPFSSLQSSETACTPDEELKQQADLIRTPEARQLFEASKSGNGALFLDVRSASEFSSGHIPHAINIPVDEVSSHLSKLPRDRTIVLYESGLGKGDNVCAAARTGGRVLLSHGYARERVKVYQDGLADWQKAGLPVAK